MCLGFRRRDAADGLQQPAIVEPVDPFERGELDGFEGAPRSATTDDLGLVEPVNHFGEGIVVKIADASDGRLDARFGQALGVSNADVLRTSVRIVHQANSVCGPSLVQDLLQRVEHEAS